MILITHAIFLAIQKGDEIPKDHWSLKIVHRLLKEGWLVGYPDGIHIVVPGRYVVSVAVAVTLDEIRKLEEGLGQEAADIRRGTATLQHSKGFAHDIALYKDSGGAMTDLLRLSREFKPEIEKLSTPAELRRLTKQAEDLPRWARAFKLPTLGEGFAQTPAWAKKATFGLRDAGLLKGYPNGYFDGPRK